MLFLLTVGQELLHNACVSVTQYVCATRLPDKLLCPFDHAVALSGLGSDNFACASNFKALLSTAFGFHLGHFASFQ
jgi:hypothetical protein